MTFNFLGSSSIFWSQKSPLPHPSSNTVFPELIPLLRYIHGNHFSVFCEYRLCSLILTEIFEVSTYCCIRLFLSPVSDTSESNLVQSASPFIRTSSMVSFKISLTSVICFIFSSRSPICCFNDDIRVFFSGSVLLISSSENPRYLSRSILCSFAKSSSV